MIVPLRHPAGNRLAMSSPDADGAADDARGYEPPRRGLRVISRPGTRLSSTQHAARSTTFRESAYSQNEEEEDGDDDGMMRAAGSTGPYKYGVKVTRDFP